MAMRASRLGVGRPSTARRNSPSMPFASPGEPSIVCAMWTPTCDAPASRMGRGISCRTRPCQQRSRFAPSLWSRGTFTETSTSWARRRSVSFTCIRPFEPPASSRSLASMACAVVTTWPSIATRRSPSATTPSHGPHAVALATFRAEPPAAPRRESHSAEGRSCFGRRRSFGSSALRRSTSSEGTRGACLRPPGFRRQPRTAVSTCEGMP
mmetsp:Transcript_103755/g.223914  ORF Transcript_103755/g.223914 Transcript_103755/m.223914 type:complete len:210 (+) Transcript_103755:650-1279(+)